MVVSKTAEVGSIPTAPAKHKQHNTKHLFRDVFWYHYHMNKLNLENYLSDLQHIWNALNRQDAIPERADAIVVGGCSDLGLAERTAELYHAGASDVIIVSGYKQEGMEITEAELLANKCVSLGVPTDVIQLEKDASNTGENILFSAELTKDLVPNLKSIILVHKPFMSLRFLATAEAQWPRPQPKFYTTCQSISFEDYCEKNGLEATAWEMLGDFKRMDEYAAKGFQTQKQIPDTARDAYKSIIRSGFTTR